MLCQSLCPVLVSRMAGSSRTPEQHPSVSRFVLQDPDEISRASCCPRGHHPAAASTCSSPPAAPSALAWVLTVSEECRPLRQRQLPRRDMRKPGHNQPRASSQVYILKSRGPGQAPTIARPARGTSSNPFIGNPRSRVSMLTSASSTMGPLASAVVPFV